MEMRSIPEEVMLEKAPALVRAATRRSRQLENWGWTDVERTYRYGPKGTGSARSFITAVRGRHGLTLEYLFLLNTMYRKPSAKFLGGFWDGGAIRGEKDFMQLARPLSSTYNHGSRVTTKGKKTMAVATSTAPRKRVAKRAATKDETPTTAPARKRAAKRAATTPDEAEPTTPKATKAAEKAAETAQRKADRIAERHAKWDEMGETVAGLRDGAGTDDGEALGWADISEQLGITQGLAQKYLYWHEARAEDGGDIPTATAEGVMEDRESGMSWPLIEVKYDITRKQAWDLYAEAGGDHFTSDIGKGGRFIERDEEEVERRRAEKAAARKSSSNGSSRRGRKPKFTGFTDEHEDDDVLEAVEGNKITWRKTRGEGEESAVVKEGSASIALDKRENRVLSFNDGRKTRNVFVKNITAVS